MRKNGLLKKWCWSTWIAGYRETNLYSYLTSYTNINSKWIIDLNIRAKIVKLLNKNMWESLTNISNGELLEVRDTFHHLSFLSLSLLAATTVPGYRKYPMDAGPQTWLCSFVFQIPSVLPQGWASLFSCCALWQMGSSTGLHPQWVVSLIPLPLGLAHCTSEMK